MSKKILILIITAVVLIPLAFSVWYLFSRNPVVPVSETLKNFLPFGSGDDLPAPTNDTTEPGETAEGENSNNTVQPEEVLVRLSETPVAGFVVLDMNASTTVVRYADRATGHIYDINLSTLEKIKITNQTLPKIYEAYFRNDGGAALFRFLRDDSDVVENLTLTLTPPKKTATSSPDDMLYTVSSTALRGDIGSVAVGSGDTLIYSLEDASSIVSSSFNGASPKTLLNSPFSDWRLAMSGNSLVIHPKAAANTQGYAYLLNTSSGSLSKILGPFKGLLATPSVSGDRILYSYVDRDETRSFVKNLTTGKVLELSVTMFAEKCVWSKLYIARVYCGSPSNQIGANEPDNWYKGISTFYDRIWSFDTDTELARVLAEPISILGFNLDVIEPKLSPKEKYLVFINKLDLSLWALKLEPRGI